MKSSKFVSLSLVCAFGVVFVAFFHFTSVNAAEATAPQVFSSPDMAVAALVDAAKKKDSAAIFAVLGSQSKEWITSGDPVQDKLGLERFLASYEKKNGLEKESDTKTVLVIGDDDFPFPFPVVKTDKGWAFDPEQGKEELLNRRIGRNELNTVQVLLAVVDAQNEYASVDRNGDGVLEYAAKLRSTPGQHDGLYWEIAEGEAESPIGPLIAKAVKEGYGQEESDSGNAETAAYHGYHYKLLTRQGPEAPGGARNYVVNGRMIGGFAVLAYPARYGNSGVMSFMVSHDGTVYDADLGPETEEEAQAIEEFDPGQGWEKVDPNR